MNALVAEPAFTSDFNNSDKEANKLCQTQNYDVKEHYEVAKHLLLLSIPRNDQKLKAKKTYRKRRKTKRLETNDVARASVFIQDTIRNYELSEVIHLLGECIFYESLFIWQKVSMKRFRNHSCSNSFGLIGDISLVVQNNDITILKLLMELPSMKSSKHYPAVVRSDDVSNQALQRARELSLGLLATRKFTFFNDIAPNCAEHIKVHHIPIQMIMIPIDETFRSCLNIVSDEGHNSARPL